MFLTGVLWTDTHRMCPTERSFFQDIFSLSQFQPIILITPFYYAVHLLSLSTLRFSVIPCLAMANCLHWSLLIGLLRTLCLLPALNSSLLYLSGKEGHCLPCVFLCASQTPGCTPLTNRDWGRDPFSVGGSLSAFSFGVRGTVWTKTTVSAWKQMTLT